jgi:hypothetical protein
LQANLSSHEEHFSTLFYSLPLQVLKQSSIFGLIARRFGVGYPGGWLDWQLNVDYFLFPIFIERIAGSI